MSEDTLLSFFLVHPTDTALFFPHILDSATIFDTITFPSFATTTSAGPISMPHSFSTVLNFVKAILKLRPTEPSWMMVPRFQNSQLISAPDRLSRSIGFSRQANQGDLSSPVDHSPEPFTTMDEQMLRQIEEAEDAPEPHVVVVEADLASVRSISRMASTGSIRPDAPQAILKGSPKTLGWEVDEEDEQSAWVMLMSDAMSSTVFEPVEEVAEEPSAAASQTKREMYKTYLEHWNEDGVSFVWKVVPSLRGIHSWILQPKFAAEASVLHAGVEMGTDTEDLIADLHTEASAQTTIKTYCDMEVQTYQIEVPFGALTPLQSTPMLDVVAPEPRPPSVESTIDSRPGTPSGGSRIPRMTAARRGSIASLASATQVATPATQPTRAESPARAAIRRSSSIRSLALKRAPSAKSSLKEVVPAAATPDVPVEKDTAAQSPPTNEAPVETTTEKLYSLARRFTRTNSVLAAWRP